MAVQQQHPRTVTDMPAPRSAPDDAAAPTSTPPDRPHQLGRRWSDDSVMGLAMLLMMAALVAFSAVFIWLGTRVW